MQGDEIVSDLDIALKKLSEVRIKPDKANKRDFMRVADSILQLRTLFHYLMRPPTAAKGSQIVDKLWSCVTHVRG